MSSVHPAKSGSNSDAPTPPSVPIGVRTHAVVSGVWIAVALACALGLGVVVFMLLPGWLAPPASTTPSTAPVAPSVPAPPARTTPSTVPVAPTVPAPPVKSATNPKETVRLRLRAEEAASRYREKSEALRQMRADAWAPEDWSAALARGKEAEAAVVAQDYTRASELYDDASRALDALEGKAEASYDRALAAGDAALQARSSAQAADAFKLALAIRPGDKKAEHGLKRAERLDGVLARLDAGESQESAGVLTQAREEYAAAVKLDPEFAPAKAALAQVDRRIAAQRFDGLMTQGLAQLERRDWSAAERSFMAALKLRPTHPAATDGLARAKEALQQETLARLQREAQALESAERWDEALAAYRRAETIDPTVDFAKTGIARSNHMIALHARINSYLAKPERLYSASVRAEVRQFLAETGNEPALGPRLAKERQRLETALERASTKVTVQLASDNATEVTLYRVGRLGRFQAREIALTPGTYTLVGSRPGYKDVRIQLIVTPDSNSPRVFVACEERV